MTVEVLACHLVLIVTIAVVPTEVSVNLEFLSIVVVQVCSQHFTGVKTTTVPPACVLVLVVEVTNDHHACLVGETASHTARGVAVMSATCQIEVRHVTVIHAFLNGEVKHCFFIAVVDAGDSCLVTLLVVKFHVLDDIHRQVLQCRLCVAEHKLFTVEQNLFYLLSVDSDVAVLIDLRARHAFDEFLDG